MNPISADVINIFDAVDLSIVVVNGDCAVARFNRAAAAMLCLTPVHIGQSLDQIPMLRDRPEILRLCGDVIRGGAPGRFEIKDEDKHFVLRIAGCPGGERTNIGAVLTFSNITALRASIEQAIYERQFTKAILNTVMEPLVVLDAGLRVQTANRAFLTMFGISREEAKGSLLTELKHHQWNVPELWVHLKEALSDNNPPPLEFDHYFPMLGQRTVLVNARRLQYGGGTAEPMILLILSDITGRKQAENAKARLAAIVEFSNDAIISKDLNGVITSWNSGAERIFGYTAAEVIGQPVTMLMPPERFHEEPGILERIRRGESIEHYETVRRSKDGRLLDISLSVSPLINAQGEIVGASKIARDITQRKQNEEALRRLNDELESRVVERTEELTESQKRLRALASELNVTEQRERQRLASDLHDYLGQLLALTRMKLSQAKQQPMKPAIAKIITEVEAVTDKALTYTRTLISQLSPPVLHEFGLPMALHWLADQMREQNLAVSVDVKTEIPLLPENQALLLFQSVRELLINCVKHAQTSKAAIAVEQIYGVLRIAVSDHGCGFDSTSGSVDTKQNAVSSGFGLFSIRERMVSLGGRLDLESAAGKGTVATLMLPLSHRNVESSIVDRQEAKVKEERDRSMNKSRMKTHTGLKIRIVVADDHAMVREGLCGLLRQYSEIQVIGEAANGEEAIAMADGLQPDVILMDVTMPKMDGLEATKVLKSKHPGVVVIGLSIHTAGQVEAAMTEAGAAAFINKEAAVDELYKTIRSCWQSTGSRHFADPPRRTSPVKC